MQASSLDDASTPGQEERHDVSGLLVASTTLPEHAVHREPDDTHPASASTPTCSNQSFDEDIQLLGPGARRESGTVEIDACVQSAEWVCGVQVEDGHIDAHHREQSTSTADPPLDTPPSILSSQDDLVLCNADQIQLETTTTSSQSSHSSRLEVLVPSELESPSPVRHESPPAVVVPPKTNKVEQLSDDNHTQRKPSPVEEEDIAALVIHTIEGRTFCSRAVTCDIISSIPELNSVTIKPEKINPFQILPTSITSIILRYACGIFDHENMDGSLHSPGEISSFWIRDLDFQVVEK